MKTCPEHPGVKLVCPACAGRLGGSSRSKKKVRAARRNVRRALEVRAVLDSKPVS